MDASGYWYLRITAPEEAPLADFTACTNKICPDTNPNIIVLSHCKHADQEEGQDLEGHTCASGHRRWALPAPQQQSLLPATPAKDPDCVAV